MMFTSCLLALAGISTTLANPIARAPEVPSPELEALAAANLTATAPKLNAAAADTYICAAARTTYSRARVLANVLYFPEKDEPGASGFPHHFNNAERFPWDPVSEVCDHWNLIEMPIFRDGHVYDWNSGGSGPRENPGPARAIYVSKGENRVLCGVLSHYGDAGYFEKCYLN